MQKDLKTLFRNIWHKKKILFFFELFIYFFSSIILYPLFLKILNYAIESSPYPYITSANVLSFLSRPLTILFILLILILWSIFYLFQFCGLCLLFDYRYNDRSTLNLFKETLHYVKRILIPQNYFLIGFFIFAIPLFLIVLSGFGSSSIEISGIIAYLFDTHLYLKVIFCIIVALYVFLFFFLLYSFNLFTIEKINFFKAVKENFKLIKKSGKSYINKFLIVNVLLIDAFLIIYILFALLIGGGMRLFSGSEETLSFFLSVMYGLTTILKYLFKVLLIIFNIALITMYFNKYYVSTEIVDELDLHISKSKHFFVYRLVIVIIFLSGLIINSISYFASTNATVKRALGLSILTEVTAHRGSSIKAPENTLLAFQYAINDNSDYAELDLRQTKDGQIVVVHDANLKRVANNSLVIHESNYEDLLQVELRNKYTTEDTVQNVPLFEEVLSLCEGEIKLNIEIKKCVHNELFFEKIYSLIKEYDFIENCVISSTELSYLKTMKKYNKHLITGIILSYAYGKYYSLNYIDFISMSYLNINKSIVNSIHSYGKEIHVWTANKEAVIISMLNYGVDNIITDNPTYTKNIIYSRKSSYITKKIADLFFK